MTLRGYSPEASGMWQRSLNPRLNSQTASDRFLPGEVFSSMRNKKIGCGATICQAMGPETGPALQILWFNPMSVLENAIAASYAEPFINSIRPPDLPGAASAFLGECPFLCEPSSDTA
jgi:hypothetical protein